jgi:AcrR family transcriptional regulator
MSDLELGRRERHVAEVRERILQAATIVFARHGYQKATTREIAEEADVAEGSIFYHFQSKRGLLLALIDASVSELLSPRSPVQADDLQSAMKEVLGRRFALVERNRALLSVLIHEVRLDEELRRQYGDRILRTAVAKLESRLNEWSALGKLRPVNTAVVARAIVGSFLSFMTLYPDPELDGIPSDEIVSSLIDFYWRGLSLPAGDQVEEGSVGGSEA